MLCAQGASLVTKRTKVDLIVPAVSPPRRWQPSVLFPTEPRLRLSTRKVADIAALKQQPGKACHAVGGASLVSTLMNEGLVDQVWLTVHPIVLGQGKPLFKDVHERHGLELLETRRLAGGSVNLAYRVA